MGCEVDIGYPHSKVTRIIKKGERTIKNRIMAWKLDANYYDGLRCNGYGGFKYDGRWVKIIPGIIERYNLTPNSEVLEIGCRKGHFLHDLKNTIPEIGIHGIENHIYPIANGMETVESHMRYGEYQSLPYYKDEFDFVFAFASIYMLNLGGVMDVLREIVRVGKGKAFVSVGAYRTEEEKDLFLSWSLIGTTILHVDEWKEVFFATDYVEKYHDYQFVTPKTLNLFYEGQNEK